MKNLMVAAVCVGLLALVFFAGPAECKQKEDTIKVSPSTINLVSQSTTPSSSKPWFFIHSDVKLSDLPEYFESSMYLKFSMGTKEENLEKHAEVFEDQTGGLVVKYYMDDVIALLKILLGGPGSAKVSVSLRYEYLDADPSYELEIGSTTISVIDLPYQASRKPLE